MTDETITSACPTCGDVAERRVYDIGSGPELSCASCEWCWGAEGQDLQSLDVSTMLAQATTEEVRLWAQTQAINAAEMKQVVDDDD